MKFIKSSLAQKLIIVLIAIMIFNIAIPKEVKAWDFAGILFKPVSTFILGILVNINVTIGLTLTGISSSFKTGGAIVEAITGDGRRSINKSWRSIISDIYWPRYYIFR